MFLLLPLLEGNVGWRPHVAQRTVIGATLSITAGRDIKSESLSVESPRRKWLRRSGASLSVQKQRAAIDQFVKAKIGDEAGEQLSTTSDATQDAVSADILLQYRLSLAREMRLYPDVARFRVRRGSVLVQLRLGEGAATSIVELVSSSGDPELDADALALVSWAAHATDVPEVLRGRPLALSLPLVFSRGE